MTMDRRATHGSATGSLAGGGLEGAVAIDSLDNIEGADACAMGMIGAPVAVVYKLVPQN